VASISSTSARLRAVSLQFIVVSLTTKFAEKFLCRKVEYMCHTPNVAILILPTRYLVFQYCSAKSRNQSGVVTGKP
jgi:hypothetical protein